MSVFERRVCALRRLECFCGVRRGVWYDVARFVVADAAYSCRGGDGLEL